MREIKFRFWDQFNGVFSISDRCGDLQVFFTGYQSTLDGGNNPILMQYTGLSDKNGKEIYEGDIVLYERVNWKCNGHPEDGETIHNICEICYCENRGAYRSKMKGHMGGRTISIGDLVLDDSRADENNFTIIGNIHENPDLLGEHNA